MQLLSWRPWVDDSKLEDSEWFRQLWRVVDSAGDGDADAELIPKVVGRCVVPRLVAALRFRWDPMSLRQSTRLVDAVKDAIGFDPPGDARQVRGALHAPSTIRTMHHAPCTMRHAPSTMHHPPCTMHHAPCTMHHAPCTASVPTHALSMPSVPLPPIRPTQPHMQSHPLGVMSRHTVSITTTRRTYLCMCVCVQSLVQVVVGRLRLAAEGAVVPVFVSTKDGCPAGVTMRCITTALKVLCR